METKTKNNKYIKPVCKRYNTKKKKKEKESRIACLSFNKLNIIPLRTFLPFKGRKKKIKDVTKGNNFTSRNQNKKERTIKKRKTRCHNNPFGAKTKRIHEKKKYPSSSSPTDWKTDWTVALTVERDGKY